MCCLVVVESRDFRVGVPSVGVVALLALIPALILQSAASRIGSVLL